MENLLKISDKTFLVTGASSGIGKSSALLLSEYGARLILLGRDKERLQQTQKELTGTNHLHFSIDLTDTSKINALIVQLKNEKIDGILHAAGTSPTLPFNYSDAAKFSDTMNINLFAALELSRGIIRKTIKCPKSIVFISSVMGIVGEKGKTIYAASKGAIIATAKAMAIELASKSIRVNSISPGVVNTPLTKNSEYRKSEKAMSEILKKHPLGLGEPNDIAKSALFLLSDQSNWITGHNLVIDGGYTSQ